jgi:hypothetical protein
VFILHVAKGWQACSGHAWTLSANYTGEARARALEAGGQLDEGIDPRDVGSGAMTVGQLAASYIAKHVRPNLRRARDNERRLAANVLPIIGSLKLSDLHRREVTKVMDRIMARGASAQAVKVFKDMSAMFRWAVARGDLEHSPTEGVRPPKEGAPRSRVLADAELKRLWHACRMLCHARKLHSK